MRNSEEDDGLHLAVGDLDGEEDEGLPLVPSDLGVQGPGEKTK